MDMYDLRYEPWIPVLMKDGSTASFGLYELLMFAHTIKELATGSPLESMSLLRLFVGLVHHMVGDIQNEREWERMYSLGQFDENAIVAYLEKSDWKDRFYLFHPEHPFWQIPGLKNIDPKTGVERSVPLITLDIAEASGNNKTLFSHRLDSDKRSYTPQEAVRLLITSQFYSLGGLNKKTTNYLGLQASYYNASLVAGMPTVVNGETLFETIMLNMVPQKHRIIGMPKEFQSMGIPPWAQTLPANLKTLPNAANKQVPRITSFLEVFLPWSRYIRLIPDNCSDTDVCVSHMAIAQGVVQDITNEPWTSKVRDLKKQEIHAVNFNTEKALWRDTGALLGAVSNNQNRSYIPPLSLSLYSSFRKYCKVLPSWKSISVMALANDKAKPLMWRKETLNLPLHMIEQQTDGRLQFIKKNLEIAEELHDALKFAIRKFYSEAFREDSSKPKKDSIGHKYAENSDVLRHYWTCLETPFRQFIHELDENPACTAFILQVFKVSEVSLDRFLDQVVKNDIRYFPAQEKARRYLIGSNSKRKQALGL